MHQTGLSPAATAGPLRLGITLHTILPIMGSDGRRKKGFGPLHRQILVELAGRSHPMTLWDIRRAVYGPKATTNHGGAVVRVLNHFMATGDVAFVGDGYQLRKAGGR